LPVLLSYVLSFIYVGIYWNNHHHLFQVTEQVSAGFFGQPSSPVLVVAVPISLPRGWVKITLLRSRRYFGFVLLMAGIAYYVLERAIIAKGGRESFLALLLAKNGKANSLSRSYLAAIRSRL